MSSSLSPALHEVVEWSYEDLVRLVRAKTGSTHLAEDVVQETWLRAARATVSTPRNPHAYVRRMAINIAIDHMRLSQTRDRLPVERQQSDGANLPEQSECAAEIEEVIASRQQMRLLVQTLQTMPDKRRNAFLLCRVGGLTMRAAGLRLGISERTVEKHVAKALIDCRHALGRPKPQI